MMSVSDIARRRGQNMAVALGFPSRPASGNATRLSSVSQLHSDGRSGHVRLRPTVPPLPNKKHGVSTTCCNNSALDRTPGRRSSIKLRSTVPPVPAKQSIETVKTATLISGGAPTASVESAVNVSVNSNPDKPRPPRPAPKRQRKKPTGTDKATVHKMVAQLKPDCIKDMKDHLTPDCLKGDTQTEAPGWLGALKKRNKEEYIAPTMECRIGGEEVILNIFPKNDEDECHDLEIDEKLTPVAADGQPFEQTCEFYSLQTEYRADVLRVIFRLGDQLLDDELDGDKDDWFQYVHRAAVEVAAWEKRRARSTELFQTTGKILGVEEKKFKARSATFGTNLLNTVKGYANRLCPCLFRDKQKDTDNMASFSTSSINIDDYISSRMW